MDVDENSAFSWPACARCGGDGLEAFEDQPYVPVIISTTVLTACPVLIEF